MKKDHTQSGFTLVELMIVVGILSVVVVGMVKLFIHTSELAEMSGNITKALTEAQTKMEEIRNADFDNIATTYPNGTTFSLSQLTGQGVIYLDSANAPSNADLYKVEVVVCWRNKYGRIIGEDLDLNGALNGGEVDSDGNGKVSSRVTLVDRIAKR